VSETDKPSLQPTSKVAPIHKDGDSGGGQTQTVEAYIVMPEVFDQMKRACSKLTIEDGEILWAQLKSMRSTPVDITKKSE